MAVEDDEDIHSVILAMFEVLGIAGVSFVDGDDAISWIDAVDDGKVKGELPQLAIIDVRLPGASGIEVSARLRKSKRLRHIPIVLTTAYHFSPQEEMDAVTQAQADQLIYKPLPAINDLREILGALFHKKELGHLQRKIS
jgi:CheY-like chemotaxis protein